MFKEHSFIESIFSVKNSDLNHKLICILGIKFKIRRNLKYKNNFIDLPVDETKILFKTFHGAYTCNPKYIAEEIIKQKLPYKLVWVVDMNILKYIKDFPENIKLVMDETPEADIEQATSKIWISHKRELDTIKRGVLKKSNQIYIQTWHGSLGIKKTGEAVRNKNKKFSAICKQDAEQFDYMISNGTYTTNFFKETFWNNGKILETGHPRNDVFFNKSNNIVEKVYKYLKIDKTKKIILYAPTFREDHDLNCYNINIERVINALNKKQNQDYIFVLRLHPVLNNLKLNFFKNLNTNLIVDATDYSDMQELLAASDIVITDYSSCIYDFMLTYKPGFIFATDKEKYENGRGLYYPLSNTPFPVAENNDELIKNIENFDYEKYKKEVKEFLDNKGCIDDGQASKRVVELIKKIIAEAQNKQEVSE